MRSDLVIEADATVELRDHVVLPIVIALSPFDEDQGMRVTPLLLAGEDMLTGIGDGWLCEVGHVAERATDALHDIVTGGPDTAGVSRELYDRAETLLIAVASVAASGEARGADGPLSALQCMYEEAGRLLAAVIARVEETSRLALNEHRAAQEAAHA